MSSSYSNNSIVRKVDDEHSELVLNEELLSEQIYKIKLFKDVIEFKNYYGYTEFTIPIPDILNNLILDMVYCLTTSSLHPLIINQIRSFFQENIAEIVDEISNLRERM